MSYLKNSLKNKIDDNKAISVKNLSKVYKIYEKPIDVLWETLQRKKKHKEYWALKNVSFDVYRTDVVGVIGRNGAGKSTLLKIIASTLDKTYGSIEVKGKVSAILELGSGFHPEYTGRQNIYMGGMVLGMSREEIDRKLQWIIDFSELSSVIDQQFKTYSSGMAARLTFSTAMSVEPDVFIVDEALAAGDSFFIPKAMKRIKDICSSGATVFFVSHSTDLVKRLCNKALYLENGEVRYFGNAQEICSIYEMETLQAASKYLGNKKEINIAAKPNKMVLQSEKNSSEQKTQAFRNESSNKVQEVDNQQNYSAIKFVVKSNCHYQVVICNIYTNLEVINQDIKEPLTEILTENLKQNLYAITIMKMMDNAERKEILHLKAIDFCKHTLLEFEMDDQDIKILSAMHESIAIEKLEETQETIQAWLDNQKCADTIKGLNAGIHIESEQIKIENIAFYHVKDGIVTEQYAFFQGDHVRISVNLNVTEKINNPAVWVRFNRSDGILATSWLSHEPTYHNIGTLLPDKQTIIIDIETLLLGDGIFIVTLALFPDKGDGTPESSHYLDPLCMWDSFVEIQVSRKTRPLMTVFDQPMSISKA